MFFCNAAGLSKKQLRPASSAAESCTCSIAIVVLARPMPSSISRSRVMLAKGHPTSIHAAENARFWRCKLEAVSYLSFEKQVLVSCCSAKEAKRHT